MTYTEFQKRLGTLEFLSDDSKERILAAAEQITDEDRDVFIGELDIVNAEYQRITEKEEQSIAEMEKQIAQMEKQFHQLEKEDRKDEEHDQHMEEMKILEQQILS